MAAAQETIQPTHKNLYHIVKNGRKSSWRKFGAGFVNKDGSINIILDLFPGQHFQLRDPQAPEAEPAPAKTVKLNRSKKAR